jgi:hypothetical protein
MTLEKAVEQLELLNWKLQKLPYVAVPYSSRLASRILYPLPLFIYIHRFPDTHDDVSKEKGHQREERGGRSL